MGLFSFFNKKNEPPPKPAFVERRFLPRWKISAPAKIRPAGQTDYLPCEIRDLNMRGFCLVTSEKLSDYNTRVELYFNDLYFFPADITVTWHKEVEGKQVYGVRFDQVRDSDREKIYRMMKENFSSCFGKLF